MRPDASFEDRAATSSPVSARVVCPCGSIFQAVSDADECWTCGRSAAAVKAELEQIIASIRALPELDPHA